MTKSQIQDFWNQSKDWELKKELKLLEIKSHEELKLMRSKRDIP